MSLKEGRNAEKLPLRLPVIAPDDGTVLFALFPVILVLARLMKNRVTNVERKKNRQSPTCIK
jgi:hypothetical protein